MGTHHRRPRRRVEPPSGRHRARRQEGHDTGKRAARPGHWLSCWPGVIARARAAGGRLSSYRRSRYWAGISERPTGWCKDIADGSAPGTAVHSGLLADFAGLGSGADLIINCTSVGMAPDVLGCPIDAALLEPPHVVYDIVYQPRETALLREAKRKGCRTVEGIGMLVHQGAASFRTWFGRDPDTEVMFSALEPYGYG